MREKLAGGPPFAAQHGGCEASTGHQQRRGLPRCQRDQGGIEILRSVPKLSSIYIYKSMCIYIYICNLYIYIYIPISRGFYARYETLSVRVAPIVLQM